MSRSLTRSFSSQDRDDGSPTFRPFQGQAFKLGANGEFVPKASAKADIVDVESDSEDEIVHKITVFEFEIEERCIKAENLAANAEAMARRLPEAKHLEKLKAKLTDHSCRCLQYATHYMKHVCFNTPRTDFDAQMFKAAADFYEIEGEFNALKGFVAVAYAVPDDDGMDTLDQHMGDMTLGEPSEDDEGDEGLDEDPKAKEASTKKAMKGMKASTKSPAKTMKTTMKASMKKAVAKAKASTAPKPKS